MKNEFWDSSSYSDFYQNMKAVMTIHNLKFQGVWNIDDMMQVTGLPGYLFTSDKAIAKKVTSHCGFGGGCINDTIIHLATSNMGFGGFGESGMGSYHGLDGFRTFSHYKSIVDKKTWLDLPMRYQPYRRIHDKLIHMFLR